MDVFILTIGQFHTDGKEHGYFCGFLSVFFPSVLDVQPLEANFSFLISNLRLGRAMQYTTVTTKGTYKVDSRSEHASR